MFTSKKSSLIERRTSEVTGEAITEAISKNSFLAAGKRKAAITTSLGNGAIKFTTTGNDFVDQFGKVSNYRQPRSYEDIAKDMSILWAKSPLATMALTFYIRLVTRVVSLFDGVLTKSVQRGQGLRHEGIVRMVWVAVSHPDTFWKNIRLFIAVGSWKDIIQMLSYDLQYNGWKDKQLNWEGFGSLILAGLENPKTKQLVLKYLPQIKSNKQCNTLPAQADNIIAKWICSLLFGTKGEDKGHTYKQYRKLKSSGTAHQWQQLISKKDLIKIDFNTIHGRALAQLVSSKFLANQGLEKKYEEWISAKPIAKFTGYVYELFKPLGVRTHHIGKLKKYQIETMNKQFLGLIETAKQGMNQNSTFIVVLDTSGSMQGELPGTGVSAYTIGKSLALYFSYLLKGPFFNHWLEFSNTTILKEWRGSTPVEKLTNDQSSIIAGTNFRSVATHFATMLRSGAKEEDFPTGILCLSDGCFNNSGQNKTETKLFLSDLKSAGFSKSFVDNFKIVLWDVPNHYYSGKPQTAFEEFADCPNLFYFSGLDGSAIAFLTGTEKQDKPTPKTAEELFEAAMDQEVLNMIEI